MGKPVVIPRPNQYLFLIRIRSYNCFVSQIVHPPLHPFIFLLARHAGDPLCPYWIGRWPNLRQCGGWQNKYVLISVDQYYKFPRDQLMRECHWKFPAAVSTWPNLDGFFHSNNLRLWCLKQFKQLFEQSTFGAVTGSKSTRGTAPWGPMPSTLTISMAQEDWDILASVVRMHSTRQWLLVFCGMWPNLPLAPWSTTFCCQVAESTNNRFHTRKELSTKNILEDAVTIDLGWKLSRYILDLETPTKNVGWCIIA